MHQRHKDATAELLRFECAAAFARGLQRLPEPPADGDHEPPSLFELLDQRRGNLFGSGSHHDAVIRSTFGPPFAPICANDLHIVDPERGEYPPRAVGKLRNDLDGVG